MTADECGQCLKRHGQHADWCTNKPKQIDVSKLLTCEYCKREKGHAPHCPLMFGMYGPRQPLRKERKA